MKKSLALFAVVLALGVATVTFDAEAKRLGGGKSSGMQRQTTTAPATPPAGTANTAGAPGQTAPVAGAAAAAAPAAAAAATKRSWMGPLAGVAAGLGLAALASHFGFGEALANMMLIGLLVMAVLLVVGFIMRKRAASQGGTLAGAGGPAGLGQAFPPPQDAAYRNTTSFESQGGSQMGSSIGSGIGSRVGAGLGGLGAGAQVGVIPAGFDTAGFARNAKSQFLALQAANDAGDIARLRDYLTPEMLETVREEIAERGSEKQETQVFGLEAQVLGVAEEESRYIASVRFTGSTRGQPGIAPDDLDEVWHLTKARNGQGGWVIAGIQQYQNPS
ncbi:MAG: Tim44-like domain-containing protein [Pseudomonadota bacterium]